jgi:hypothetical protein
MAGRTLPIAADLQRKWYSALKAATRELPRASLPLLENSSSIAAYDRRQANGQMFPVGPGAIYVAVSAWLCRKWHTRSALYPLECMQLGEGTQNVQSSRKPHQPSGVTQSSQYILTTPAAGY